MQYSLNEIMAVTSSCLVYKKSNSIFDKTYKLTCEFKNADNNTIFIPYELTINKKSVNTFSNGTVQKAVLQKGVKALILDKEFYFNDECKKILDSLIEQDLIDFVLVSMVYSTIGSLKELAQYTMRTKIPKKTRSVLITGSIGKTTTTQMISNVLSKSHKVLVNSVLNLRKSILDAIINIDDEYEYLIFECSGATKGYLAQYSDIFLPAGIIITRATSESVGVWGSIDSIAREKSTLMTSMTKQGVAVVDDSKYFRRYSNFYQNTNILFVKDGSWELIETGKTGSKFKYKNENYEIPVVGLHQIDNAIKVIELSKALNVSYNDIYEGLKTFKQSYDRWVVDSYKNDVTVVIDIPNNPSYETLIANIKTFMNLYKKAPYKRLCISSIQGLGNFELDYYKKIAKYLITLDVDEIVVLDTEKDNKVKFIYDFIKQNSNIKTLFFERPKELDLNDNFVNYLVNSLDFAQATLIKIQDDNNNLKTGRIKDILKEALKDRFIERK